mmetsp:Transcript_1242/g.2803  ORF Transcript_1242/g.2803 Transcript_1242/m.2803 type:complete len:563 (+) Transcript_1242:70-1758(+)
MLLQGSAGAAPSVVATKPATVRPVPTTYRALVAGAAGESFRDVAKVAVVDTPALAADEVLVEVRYAGINGGCETFRAGLGHGRGGRRARRRHGRFNGGLDRGLRSRVVVGARVRAEGRVGAVAHHALAPGIRDVGDRAAAARGVVSRVVGRGGLGRLGGRLGEGRVRGRGRRRGFGGRQHSGLGRRGGRRLGRWLGRGLEDGLVVVARRAAELAVCRVTRYALAPFVGNVSDDRAALAVVVGRRRRRCRLRRGGLDRRLGRAAEAGRRRARRRVAVGLDLDVGATRKRFLVHVAVPAPRHHGVGRLREVLGDLERVARERPVRARLRRVAALVAVLRAERVLAGLARLPLGIGVAVPDLRARGAVDAVAAQQTVLEALLDLLVFFERRDVAGRRELGDEGRVRAEPELRDSPVVGGDAPFDVNRLARRVGRERLRAPHIKRRRAVVVEVGRPGAAADALDARPRGVAQRARRAGRGPGVRAVARLGAAGRAALALRVDAGGANRVGLVFSSCTSRAVGVGLPRFIIARRWRGHVAVAGGAAGEGEGEEERVRRGRLRHDVVV